MDPRNLIKNKAYNLLTIGGVRSAIFLHKTINGLLFDVEGKLIVYSEQFVKQRVTEKINA